MKDDLHKEIELPSTVQARFVGKILHVKGPKGEVVRAFIHPKVTLTVEGNKIVVISLKATKREKSNLSTFVAHIKNIIKGVQEHHVYKMKICSGHFPMTVSVSGQEFIVKNFLGESGAKKVPWPAGVQVKVSGTEILIESADKELAGMTASKIELLCKIRNRDVRIFQDGCYMVHKAGKEIA